MAKPKFSIVTVCYNAGDKLHETIATALQQTYENFEIIIKDGLSKDDSLQRVPEDERIFVYSYKDQGIYDAMNQALKEITGDYVYFLNCGDSFYDENVFQANVNNIVFVGVRRREGYKEIEVKKLPRTGMQIYERVFELSLNYYGGLIEEI